jgi:hypothetical protein
MKGMVSKYEDKKALRRPWKRQGDHVKTGSKAHAMLGSVVASSGSGQTEYCE